MKVLFVVNEYSFFAQNRMELALEWKRRGAEVAVASSPRGVDTAQLATVGLQHFPYPLARSGLNPLAELGSIRSLRRIYRRFRPDVVHHFTIKPVIYGTFAARLARVPQIVNTVTGLGYVFTEPKGLARRLLGRWVRQLYRWVLASPQTKVVFLNSTDRDYFCDQSMVSPNRAFILPGSGVDTDTFVESPESTESPVRILVPCRMLWHKGVGECMEAAKLLRERGLKFELWLAGGCDPGNPAAIPESQLRQWESEGLCRWLGQVSTREIRALYQRCSIVCLPSYREGIPRSLLEAAASGRPMVTTDAPGCRDVVAHEVNGLLVPPRDAAALARALQTLIESPDLRKKLGAQARRMVVERHSMKRVIEEMFRIYNTI